MCGVVLWSANRGRKREMTNTWQPFGYIFFFILPKVEYIEHIEYIESIENIEYIGYIEYLDYSYNSFAGLTRRPRQSLEDGPLVTIVWQSEN